MTVSSDLNIGPLDNNSPLSNKFELNFYNRLTNNVCILDFYSSNNNEQSLVYKDLNNYIINTFLKNNLDLPLETYQIKII